MQSIFPASNTSPHASGVHIKTVKARDHSPRFSGSWARHCLSWLFLLAAVVVQFSAILASYVLLFLLLPLLYTYIPWIMKLLENFDVFFEVGLCAAIGTILLRCSCDFIIKTSNMIFPSARGGRYVAATVFSTVLLGALAWFLLMRESDLMQRIGAKGNFAVAVLWAGGIFVIYMGQAFWMNWNSLYLIGQMIVNENTQKVLLSYERYFRASPGLMANYSKKCNNQNFVKLAMVAEQSYAGRAVQFLAISPGVVKHGTFEHSRDMLINIASGEVQIVDAAKPEIPMSEIEKFRRIPTRWPKI